MYFTLRDYPNYLIESEKTAELTHDPVLKEITAAAKAGYRRDGARDLMLTLYASQKKFYLQGKLQGTLLAKTCLRLAKRQEALDLLREAYDRHETAFLMIRESLDLLTLKDEPEYQELLCKLNVPRP
jgi:hypothetical protein